MYDLSVEGCVQSIDFLQAPWYWCLCVGYFGLIIVRPVLLGNLYGELPQFYLKSAGIEKSGLKSGGFYHDIF